MKSNTKVPKSVLSMKDALSEFRTLKVEPLKENKDWRDGIWNYPDFISTIFKKNSPFSYFLLFLAMALLFGAFLQSRVFSSFLRSNSHSNEQYTEGMVGAISSLNPLFASNNSVDKAIENLIFEKFVYIDNRGKPIPGIAQEWSVSSDSLTYTFTIKNDLHWNDGTNLTVDDILFTFNTAIALASEDSVGAALVGIKINKIDDSTIQFILSEANPTFYEAVSVYIVSQNMLGSVDFKNIRDVFQGNDIVGSGKYIVEKKEQNTVYLADNPYDGYYPKLKKLILKVYPDTKSLETALRVGDIDALGSLDSESLSFMKEYPSFGVLYKNETFRNRILFFNMRKEELKDKNMRIGLSYLLDKNELLKEARIEGKIMRGPYSEDSWVFNDQINYYDYDPSKAVELLSASGYTKNAETGYYESKDNKILSFTLSYLDNDINNRLVNSIVKLLDKEGIVIRPNKLNYNELSQKVVATRDFEILLYEIETTVDPDQYNLWHSLKVNDPFLNFSGYQYERVDILLEDARKTTNEATRKTRYLLFQKYLMADEPVIFLYHPTYAFYFDSRIHGINLDNINFSYNRYWNIEDWYWEN